MPKGNQFINKSLSKDIENGHIIQELSKVEFERRMYSLFKPISPTYCIICGSPLKSNEYYNRFAISSYGIIRCPVTYWVCSNPILLVGITIAISIHDKKRSYNTSLNNNSREWINRHIIQQNEENYKYSSNLVLVKLKSTVVNQKGGKTWILL